mgnify:CR=1 FL=1
MMRIRGRIGDWPVDLTLELDAEDWAQLAQHVAVTPTAGAVAPAPTADAGDALWQTALQLVRDAGRECLTFPGDLSDPEHCRRIIAETAQTFGKIDILVNNAAHQLTFDKIEDIPDEEWRYTFATNIDAMFYLTKAAVPHMGPGSSIINTASINSDNPSPNLLAYATTKGAIQNFTMGLAQMLAERGIRANAVAPGPVWTPLIPASMDAEKVSNFGANYPIGRPAQPVELASAYVMLAEPMSSYVSGTTIAVTGGKPMM